MSSIEGLPSPTPEKANKKSFHRRNDSDELDVFEAARYFSGYNEAPPPKIITKEERPSWRGGGRISLDMPIRTVLDQKLLLHHHDVDHKPTMKEKIKYKQPSSPGGKLASFLTSLFNQSSSKKKKPISLKSMKYEEEEIPSGIRRIRRSSISHFPRATNTTTCSINDAKSIYSSSSSGFRTPPPYVAQVTTAKVSKKDWTISHSDHKPVVTNVTKHNVTSHSKSQVSNEKVFSKWSEEKSEYINRLLWPEKCKSTIDQEHNKGVFLKRNSEVVDDDDAASDSSSDLFELQINNDVANYYTSDFPVYETTNVGSITNIRVATIANAS